MTTHSEPTLDDRLAEAADWHARMDCGTGDLTDFEAWRSADPRNAAAFARMLGAAAEISRLKPALRQRSRSAATDRRRFIQAAVASAGALCLGGGAFAILRGNRVSASTGIGDYQRVVLAGGGQLDINTDTSVQWRMDDGERTVWLKKGEIALSVPPSSIPMCLYAGGQRVVFDGGSVNARLRNGALDLLVLDGAARVRPSTSTGDAVTVRAGEAVLAGDTIARTRVMSANDIEFVSAWQQRQVYFNGETLGAAVEEYNRYLPKKISIGDPSIQGIRLGGRFNTHDPADFLASLHDGFAINAIRTADGSIVLTR